jgi:hypothetical protein
VVLAIYSVGKLPPQTAMVITIFNQAINQKPIVTVRRIRQANPFYI